MWHFFSRKSKQVQQPVHPVQPVMKAAPQRTQVALARSQRVALETPVSQSIDVTAEHIKSVLAAGEYLEGNVKFQRGAKIDGRIKGNVEFGIADGMLVLNKQGIIEGDILGPRAIIVGEVIGDIMISGRLTVLPNAIIHGDIVAGTLQIHEGSSINGRIQTISEYERQKTIEAAHQQPEDEQVSDQKTGRTQGEVLRFCAG